MSGYMDSLVQAYFKAPANQARQSIRKRNQKIVHSLLKDHVRRAQRRRFLKSLIFWRKA